MRPVYTVAGDGLQGLASAFMMIRSGQFDVVVVESHAKPSDVETLGDIVNMAMDPPITMAPPYGLRTPPTPWPPWRRGSTCIGPAPRRRT